MKRNFYLKTLSFFSLFCFFLLLFGELSSGKEVKNKKLFAYVGGVNELVKIDLNSHKIAKNLRFPGGGHIVFGLSINPDGSEIYSTGDLFAVPMIVINSKTLEIKREISERGFEDAKIGGTFGSYGCRGKLSPDGRRYAMDLGGGFAPFVLMDTLSFKIIDHPKEFRSNPIYHVVFSDDNKVIYLLTRIQFMEEKIVYKNKIIILDAETGKILREVSMPPDLAKVTCGTNISSYIGEESNIYFVCNRSFNDYGAWGLFKGDVIYPFVSTRDSKKIELIELRTRKRITEIPMPDGYGSVNQITLTPDGKKVLIGRGGYRHPGELTIVDVKSKKVIARIMLEGGATSNVVFGCE
ncbi:MAG: hypothetical protein AB1502_04730 [Thermodesulfobacteriota bacterium]